MAQTNESVTYHKDMDRDARTIGTDVLVFDTVDEVSIVVEEVAFHLQTGACSSSATCGHKRRWSIRSSPNHYRHHDQ